MSFSGIHNAYFSNLIVYYQGDKELRHAIKLPQGTKEAG
jgi:hypothetical protein